MTVRYRCNRLSIGRRICLVHIVSDEVCQQNEPTKAENRFATLIDFAPKQNYDRDNCSVHIANGWSNNMQNGFGVFLARTMDCSSMMTIECLPGSALVNRVRHTEFDNITFHQSVYS
jgi:hypothetical protein